MFGFDMFLVKLLPFLAGLAEFDYYALRLLARVITTSHYTRYYLGLEWHYEALAFGVPHAIERNSMYRNCYKLLDDTVGFLRYANMMERETYYAHGDMASTEIDVIEDLLDRADDVYKSFEWEGYIQ